MKAMEGIVHNINMIKDKTIGVSVIRKLRHKCYGGVIYVTKKYLVHTERKDITKNQKITIVSCRPISKRKTWRVKE